MGLWTRIFGRKPNEEARALQLPPSDTNASSAFDSDRARKIEQDDPLRRARWIAVFEKQLEVIPVDSSYVFSLEGPWGSGKTSVLDTLEGHLDEKGIAVLRFNPWLFAGTHDLVGSFFRELAAQLNLRDTRYKTIANVFGALAGALGAVAVAASGGGAIVGMQNALKSSSEGLNQAAQLRDETPSLLEAKRKLAKELAKSRERLIVLVDDLERLTGREVLDVLRAVRVIADLPGVTYVLAFDRERLTKALAGENEDSAFLDKIVQIPMRLPSPPADALQLLLAQKIDAVSNALPHRPIDQQHWNELATTVVFPLVKTPRDVVRLANAVAAALAHLSDRVALEEIIAMEALRIMEPSFFNALRLHRTDLTMGDDIQVELVRSIKRHDRRQRKNKTEASPVANTRDVLVAAANEKEVCRAALMHMFPGLEGVEPYDGRTPKIRGLRRGRRVGVTEVFDLYFEAEPRAGVLDLAFVAAVASATTNDQLETALENLTPAQLEYLFRSLADHAAVIAEREDAVTYVLTLLHYGCRLMIGAPGFMMERPVVPLVRLVLRVLESREQSGRLGFWLSLINQASSMQLAMLADVSTTTSSVRQGWDATGFTKDNVDAADKVIKARVRALKQDELLSLRKPGWLMRWAYSDQHGALRALLDDPRTFAAYTLDAFTHRVWGDSHKTEARIDGRAFLGLVDDEADLRIRLAELISRDLLPRVEADGLRAALASEQPILGTTADLHDNDDDGDSE